jgi:hypothetical protein
VRWNRLSRGPPAGDSESLAHPRTISWVGTTALAMGGSNQSLFLIGALVISQGSAAIPLLAVGRSDRRAAGVDPARADRARCVGYEELERRVLAGQPAAVAA